MDIVAPEHLGVLSRSAREFSCLFSGFRQVYALSVPNGFAPDILCVRNRGTTVASDLHIFGVRCGEWTTPNISPRPVGRFAHAACAVVGGKSFLVFGGVNPGEDLDDVMVLTAA